MDFAELMPVCRQLSLKSDCRRKVVGAVLVNKNGVIIGRGFNRKVGRLFLDGLIDCCELRDRLNCHRGFRAELCTAVHAEQMAIANAIENRFTTKGSRMAVCAWYADGRLAVKKEKSFSCTLCSRWFAVFGIEKVLVPVGTQESYSGAVMSLEEVLISAYQTALGNTEK